MPELDAQAKIETSLDSRPVTPAQLGRQQRLRREAIARLTKLIDEWFAAARHGTIEVRLQVLDGRIDKGWATPAESFV